METSYLIPECKTDTSSRTNWSIIISNSDQSGSKTIHFDTYLHILYRGETLSHDLPSASAFIYICGWPKSLTCKLVFINYASRGVLPETLGGGVRPASQNPYLIYDQHARKTIPFGVAHTYIADIREYPLPRGVWTFFSVWKHMHSQLLHSMKMKPYLVI